MPWHIISIGDEAYLFKIFQFLAMLNSPGTSLYGRLGMLGALIGLMLVLFQIVSSSGRNFSFGSLMIGIVMFTVLFGTSTNVELEDFHTGRTDIVDGVPLGTAILGTLVSQGGVALIDLFQQGTAVPGEEVMPSDYALRALSATYTLSSMPGCGNNNKLCPLIKTLRSYWSNCVYPQSLGLGTGTTGWANGDPTTSPDALKAIASSNRFTITSDWIHDSTGTVSPQTCADTYTDVQQFFSSTAGTDSFACQYLAAAGQAVPNNASPGACTAQAESLLQNSFNGLQSGIDTSGGQTMQGLATALQTAQGSNLLALQNLVIASAAHDAQASGGKGTASDIANASMIESAAQQRDIRYASEESMFGRTLNATIAFFEGIIYGLAPFMAFLVPLGAIGIKYLGQYLKLLVWLFLWLPLLSFVNLYEIMATMRQMNALQPTLNGAPLYSMVGIMQVQNSAADWIALGGWFTTSIIGLSGMIVFGSVAAFQSIAQAAHGPDAVDSTAVAPELASSAPVVQSGAMYSQSGGEGMHLAGGPAMQFSAGTSLQKNRQIAAQSIVNSLRSLGIQHIDQRNLNEQAVHQQLLDQFGSHVHGVNDTKTDSTGKTSSVGQDAVHSDGTATKVGAAAKGSVEAEGGFEVFGTGAKAKLAAELHGSRDKSWQDANAIKETHSTGGGHQETSTNGVQDQHGKKADDQWSLSHTYVDTKSAGWNEQLQQTLSALHSYTETASQTSQIGASSTVNANQVASQLSKPEHASDLASAKATMNDLGSGARGYYQQTYEQLHEVFPNSAQADAVATMATLQWAANNETGAAQSMATEGLLKGLNAVNPMMSATSMRDTTDFLEQSQAIDRMVSQTGGVDRVASAAAVDALGRVGPSGGPADTLLRTAQNAAVAGHTLLNNTSDRALDAQSQDANHRIDKDREHSEALARNAPLPSSPGLITMPSLPKAPPSAGNPLSFPDGGI